MPSAKQGSSEPHRGSSPEELTSRFRFPHPAGADLDGFLAVGGDLKPGTLLLAYGNGIFPWTTRPITWWSPDPRAIIPIGGLHVSHSLKKLLRRSPFAVSFDTAFTAVMKACAGPRPGSDGVWISPQFVTAYTRLHELGFAHSVEVRAGGELVGGLYGVSIGGFFAGESMFSGEENGSKVALVAIEERLRSAGYTLFDVQFLTPHLQSMGAVEVPRDEYLRRLREATQIEPDFSRGEV
jgi:leucyl/phenylalanyl-tRNA--protein transferase